ncbi:uncharacterized protein [Drosophila bipectinata]|uniref:uncharacterized protein n=1 Tax=Drosophila bipectinata TaxID=42026 RepID=UPI001C89886C|nr:uncharacterized protein LOC108123881 [Drosophila bipectinata]
MSRPLSRVLGSIAPGSLPKAIIRADLLRSQSLAHGHGLPMAIQRANYSKRNGSPPDAGESYKTVSKSRDLDDDDMNSLEGELNWELTSSKNNRFFLPNATGPAWQGDSTTVGLLGPLADLVNFFQEPNVDKSRLEFSCCPCPLLIRESLMELFPVRAVAENDTHITMLILSHEGDIEQGAAKFVLAARDMCDRLLSLGYWADFLNPFSGRPYFMPKEGTTLYKQDHRFRGLNMRLSYQNNCRVIAPEENDRTRFSGTIYCTAPSHYAQVVELLLPPGHPGLQELPQ